MGSSSPELSLDFKPTYTPKTISCFLGEISTIGNISERLSKLNEYVNRLEEEMRKIDAFKRELPLSMLLISDAIVALKEGTMQCTTSDVQPVMEEFIPLKRNSDEDGRVKKEKDSRDKKNWMSSAQLWNSNGDSDSNISNDKKQGSVERIDEEDRSATTENQFLPCKYWIGGGAFMPFKGFSGFPATMTGKEDREIQPVQNLSLMTPGTKIPSAEPSSGSSNLKSSDSTKVLQSSLTGNGQSNLQMPTQQPLKKQRRCWSPELHRRFVGALQQLGGSQVATPKQIRELMKVDGLTNDEVKSHLQKYRLHNRRLAPANEPVVVLGGLWVPQDQYGASKASTSQSGSPQGPLQLAGAAGGISTTGGDSMEDEEDGRSESYSWKGHLHKPGEDDE